MVHLVRAKAGDAIHIHTTTAVVTGNFMMIPLLPTVRFRTGSPILGDETP
jgi:hypothetical protein